MVAQFVGLGLFGSHSFRSSLQREKMKLLLKRVVSFCPLFPGHLPITFHELVFKCTCTISEDIKPIHLETVPWKLRTKRVCFQLHRLQGCHCQDKTSPVTSKVGRWDRPISRRGPSSSLCHPGIHLLRFLFFSILK